MPGPLPPPFDTVVFDLDGTLIDSEPDLRAALNKLLDELGRRAVTRPEVVMMIGDGVPKLVERALAATGGRAETDTGDPVARYMAFYNAAPADLSTLFPGAVDLLAELHAAGTKLGLCTNKPEAPAREILRLFGIDGYFGAVVGGDTLPGIRKPDPRHLQAVLDGLGATPEAAVMVGDNANDIDTAKALGVPSVAVSFGYAHGPVEDLGADIVIDRFADLPAALGGLA